LKEEGGRKLIFFMGDVWKKGLPPAVNRKRKFARFLGVVFLEGNEGGGIEAKGKEANTNLTIQKEEHELL